jgi:hypothetical protein
VFYIWYSDPNLFERRIVRTIMTASCLLHCFPKFCDQPAVLGSGTLSGSEGMRVGNCYLDGVKVVRMMFYVEQQQEWKELLEGF